MSTRQGEWSRKRHERWDLTWKLQSVPTCSCVPSGSFLCAYVKHKYTSSAGCDKESVQGPHPPSACGDRLPKAHPWTSSLLSLSFTPTGYSLPFVFYQPLHSNLRFIENTRLNRITSDNTASLQISFSCVDRQMFAGYGIASSDLLPPRADLGATVCSSVWLSHQRMSMKA